MISVPTGRHERGCRGGGHHAVRGIREVQGEVRESAPPREPEPARLSLTEGCRSANCRLELNYGMQEEVGEQPSSKNGSRLESQLCVGADMIPLMMQPGYKAKVSGLCESCFRQSDITRCLCRAGLA